VFSEVITKKKNEAFSVIVIVILVECKATQVIKYCTSLLVMLVQHRVQCSLVA